MYKRFMYYRLKISFSLLFDVYYVGCSLKRMLLTLERAVCNRIGIPAFLALNYFNVLTSSKFSGMKCWRLRKTWILKLVKYPSFWQQCRDSMGLFCWSRTYLWLLNVIRTWYLIQIVDQTSFSSEQAERRLLLQFRIR